ncbi:MAG: TonB-dependent receptor plug domain-containing protein, partial [Flavobacteriales bacterium]
LINTEVLNRGELKRSACCDLSESFETNATVDVSFNDAISGTKTIRMLGLDGKYAQMSVENIPFIRGLSTASGLTLIPGPWINEINLSKGIGTAVNAPSAMTGQIDVCLLQPANEPPLFVNLFGSSQGRMEANIHSAQKTGPNSGNLLMAHGNWFRNEMDQNGDGFMDMPLTQRVNLTDRWVRRTDRRTTMLTARFVDDRRDGGQSMRHGALPAPAEHAGHRPEGLYGIAIRNRMADLLGKQGFILSGREKSIGLVFAGRLHETESAYGIRRYAGRQESLYGNAVYQQMLGGCEDQVKAGFSFQYDRYAEAFSPDARLLPDSAFGRTELMPGAFAEYTRKRERLTLVAGLRADFNSVFGNALSPRLHLKYDLGPLTSIRLSAGHGFRTANPLAEHAAVLASSRRVVTEGPLGMERAWNTGASFLHKFKWLGRKWALGADAYRTWFTRQVVADLDRSPQAMAFYMLDGASYANSLLAELQVQLARELDLKMSYRWYDVRTTYDGRLLERPFTPTHRGLIDLAFHDAAERWRFDIALNVFGDGRLPSTAANPAEHRLPDRSPAYGSLHAQVTRVEGPWEFYLGGENLTNALQRRQIIAPDDPYGPFFDATLIWGPTYRAMAYAGLRYSLNRPSTTSQP